MRRLIVKRKCAVCNRTFEQPAGIRARITCSPECALARRRGQNRESRERAIAQGCPPDKHGTVTGYTHFRCSCVACRRWAADYKQQRRSKIEH